MMNFKIDETDEYRRLVPFFIENGLEFTDEDMEEVPTDLVKCWKITAGSGISGTYEDKLIGGFVLAKREGEFICDGIATDPEYRGTGLGRALLAKGIEEVTKLGGSRMYLVARAPEFFRKNGFETIGRDEAPNFFECLTCPQYKVSCHPEVMRIDL
ncbi:MAG: GNAT family N-acetyltransferase [Bacillota bacterium]|nr:GNAT family N-acetyltransferase [Bacillota bacterium]